MSLSLLFVLFGLVPRAGDELVAERRHFSSEVATGRGLNQVQSAFAGGDMNRVAWHAKADLHLRAYGHEFDVRLHHLHRRARDDRSVVPARLEFEALADDDSRSDFAQRVGE